MKRLFVDTAGWMAMADSNDPLHKKSLHCRDQWLEDGAILVISDYIVYETLTLVRRRLGVDAAKKLWRLISDSPRCKKEWITPERLDKAVQLFFQWYGQSFSLTDCTSFIVMRELWIEDALTADSHFSIAGFCIHPG